MTRKAIFKAVRDTKADVFNEVPERIGILDGILDDFGVPRDKQLTGFDRAFELILGHEGGFVNDPDDPGGVTNLGVTIATWRKWKGSPVTIADMKALTVDDIKPMYRAWYWDEAHCDELPAGLALHVFDVAVNSGPARAIILLQRVCKAEDDGVFGPATRMALQAAVAAHGERKLVARYSEARRAFYRALPTFWKYGKGWLRRVDETEAAAMEIANAG